MKAKLITALSSIPIIAAMSMSGTCAVSCPYGMINDPYPGQCPRYTDLNGDGICDLSQVTAAATTTDDSTTSSDTSTDSSSTDNTQTSSINDQSHGHGAVSDQLNPDSQVDSTASLIHDPGTGLDTGNLHEGTGYYAVPVSILLISGYLLTHYLFTKGILKREKHRRLWNLLLTAGYIGTGSTGVILIFLINLGIKTVLNPTITFWHAELAILMTICTLIHVHLYWKPFKNIFKVLFGLKSNRKSSSQVLK